VEGQSNGTNRISKIGRVSHRTTKKLERSHKVNGISLKHHEEAIQQEKMKSTEIKERR